MNQNYEQIIYLQQSSRTLVKLFGNIREDIFLCIYRPSYKEYWGLRCRTERVACASAPTHADWCRIRQFGIHCPDLVLQAESHTQVFILNSGVVCLAASISTRASSQARIVLLHTALGELVTLAQMAGG